MKLIIKATELDLTPSLKMYIEQKLIPLARFLKRFDTEGAAELRVEVAWTTFHHKRGEVFRAEANLTLPGVMLRATQEDVDVRTAVDKVKRKLKMEIEKHKAKVSAKPRRPGKASE